MDWTFAVKMAKLAIRHTEVQLTYGVLRFRSKPKGMVNAVTSSSFASARNGLRLLESVGFYRRS
jgi:hypothetical protein